MSVYTEESTLIKITLVDTSDYMVDVDFYRGDDQHEAEQVDAFLEMCIAVTTALKLDSIVHVCAVARVLQDNGHAPDCMLD